MYMAETLASWMASLLTVWWEKRAAEVRKGEREKQDGAALWQTALCSEMTAPWAQMTC